MTEYRANSRACPGCGAPMDETATTQALLDQCPECGGLWVDWLDGDLRTTAKRVATARLGGRAAGTGSRRCPVCDVGLTDDTAGGDATPIARCGECAGAFVPAASLAQIRGSLPRPSAGPADETSALTRLLDTLTRWILPG